MRRLVAVLCVLILVFSSVPQAYAHPGRTDENGGHYDSEAGEYHYHHGYPAHQHTDLDGDGIPDCPYEFDDRTGWNSGTSSSGSSSSITRSSAAGRQTGVSPLVWLIAGIGFIVFITIYSGTANRRRNPKNSIMRVSPPESPYAASQEPPHPSEPSKEQLLDFIHSCTDEAYKEIFKGKRSPYTKAPVDSEILYRIYVAIYRQRHGTPPELPGLQDKIDLVNRRNRRLLDDRSLARRFYDAGVTNLLHIPDELSDDFSEFPV